MIRAGFETTDRTQTRTVLVKAAEETGGRGWVLEVHCPEGAPAANPAHIHDTWPIPIQKGLAATLGPLAEALGYRGVYDRYLR